MRSWILLLSATMLSGAIFVLIMTQTQPPLNIQDVSSDPLRDQAPKSEDLVKVDRSIAAISPAFKKKLQYLGVTPEELKVFPRSNKRADDWQAKFEQSFEESRSLLGFNSFQIKHKRSVLKKENKSLRHFEHIVVRYKLPNGNPFSFEALIDSETGTMVQSWNKTRYERREPTSLDGTNKMFLRSL